MYENLIRSILAETDRYFILKSGHVPVFQFRDANKQQPGRYEPKNHTYKNYTALNKHLTLYIQSGVTCSISII